MSAVEAASLFTPALAGGGKNSMVNPDFTKGVEIPEGASHDWTLGATATRRITSHKFADQLLDGPPPRKDWEQFYKR